MTVEKIFHVDMDVHREPIEALAGMNLHDAAEYQARHARIAHPNYKRHGRIDVVNGHFTPYTADELADMKAARTERRAVIALCALIAVCGAIGVLIIVGAKSGWLLS